MANPSKGAWTRRAVAWMLALALCLGLQPPLPVSTAGADSFVSADICSTGHGQADGPAESLHDCGTHCCLVVAKAPPPAPFSAAPVVRLVAERLPAIARPAPDTAPRTDYAPRAPPPLVA